MPGWLTEPFLTLDFWAECSKVRN